MQELKNKETIREENEGLMKDQTGYLGIPFTLVWMPVATPTCSTLE